MPIQFSHMGCEGPSTWAILHGFNRKLSQLEKVGCTHIEIFQSLPLCSPLEPQLHGQARQSGTSPSLDGRTQKQLQAPGCPASRPALDHQVRGLRMSARCSSPSLAQLLSGVAPPAHLSGVQIPHAQATPSGRPALRTAGFAHGVGPSWTSQVVGPSGCAALGREPHQQVENPTNTRFGASNAILLMSVPGRNPTVNVRPGVCVRYVFVWTHTPEATVSGSLP